MTSKKGPLTIYRIWTNVPHYKDIVANSEEEARDLMADAKFETLTAGWDVNDQIGWEQQDDIEVIEVVG